VAAALILLNFDRRAQRIEAQRAAEMLSLGAS
jgi:hypothetical protein